MSDRGGEFINEILANVHRLMGVQAASTTRYRPNSNGVLERVHSTINHVFAKTVRESQTDWCEMTPCVAFAYNCAYHTGTTYSPLYLMFLREPRVSLDLALGTECNGDRFQNWDDYTDSVKRRMEKAYELVGESLKQQFDRMKKWYDRRVKEARFVEWQYVW